MYRRVGVVFTLFIWIFGACEQPVVDYADDEYMEKNFVSFNNDFYRAIIRYYQMTPVEQSLELCKPNAACNIIHRRYWVRPYVTRLCRCEGGFECSRQLYIDTNRTEGQDNRTMHLDNRSQLKFCTPLDLPTCNADQTAISVRSWRLLNADGEPSKFVHKAPEVQASCRCAPDHYWQQTWREVNGTNVKFNFAIVDETFRCRPYRECRSKQFCGFTRKDTYSTYYRCSCPFDHMCLFVNETSFPVEELLFHGLAYRSICQPDDESTRESSFK